MILCGFRGPVFDRTKSKMMWNFYGLIWISRSQVIPPTIYINHTHSLHRLNHALKLNSQFFFSFIFSISMGLNNLIFEKYSIAIYDITNNSNAQNVTDVVFRCVALPQYATIYEIQAIITMRRFYFEFSRAIWNDFIGKIKSRHTKKLTSILRSDLKSSAHMKLLLMSGSR